MIILKNNLKESFVKFQFVTFKNLTSLKLTDIIYVK